MIWIVLYMYNIYHHCYTISISIEKLQKGWEILWMLMKCISIEFIKWIEEMNATNSFDSSFLSSLGFSKACIDIEFSVVFLGFLEFLALLRRIIYGYPTMIGLTIKMDKQAYQNRRNIVLLFIFYRKINLWVSILFTRKAMNIFFKVSCNDFHSFSATFKISTKVIICLFNDDIDSDMAYDIHYCINFYRTLCYIVSHFPTSWNICYAKLTLQNIKVRYV